MSKELTEKWENGELPSGYYYLTNGEETYIHECFKSIHKHISSRFIFLAPVPSYEEFQSYEKCADMLIDVNKKWGKTIKENKRLQEQKQKVIALIKDGRFVEALQELENEDRL